MVISTTQELSDIANEDLFGYKHNSTAKNTNCKKIVTNDKNFPKIDIEIVKTKISE